MGNEPAYLDANGIRFAYFSEGTGPLVLMVHGFPDTPHTWDLIRPRIAEKGYRVVAPYTRGYHPTQVPERDADAETLGRDLLAIADALGEKELILVGHDFGAAAAYAATGLAQERIKKLFAVGIPHPATVTPTLRLAWGARHFVADKLPGAASRFAKNDFAALPEIYKRWSPTWSPPPEEFEPIRESFSHRPSLDAAFGYYRALNPRDRPEYLREKIAVPTVVFSGKDDPLLTLANYEGARRMFTGEYVIEETRGGHFLHREDPETFAEKLLAHL